MKKILTLFIVLFLSISIVLPWSMTVDAATPLLTDTELDFSTKKVTFLGDSLTQINYLPLAQRWPTMVANELGFGDYVNMGLGGSKISPDLITTDSFLERVVDVPLDSDYVFVMGGLNDYANDRTMLEFEDAFVDIMEYLRTNLPDAVIIVMTYFNTGTTGVDYSLIPNDENLTVNDYYEAMIDNSGDFITGVNITGKIQVLDMYNLIGIDAGSIDEDREVYTTDGVHPNYAGNRRIANMVISFLGGENLRSDSYFDGFVKSDGSFDETATYVDYHYSDKIPVTPGKHYAVYSNGQPYTYSGLYAMTTLGGYFDADDQFISPILNASHLYEVITAPEGAAYMRINVRKTNEDTAFFVRMLINDFIVKFDTNGANLIQPIYASKDDITLPLSPVRAGYIFMGWYNDNELTSQFDYYEPQIEDNITLYAKWTLNTGGGTVTPPETEASNTTMYIVIGGLVVLAGLGVLTSKKKKG